MRAILLACGLAMLALAGAGARPAAAQTREDSASVWLDAARQLRLAGQPAAADALLELLRRRFGGTAASQEAERLLAVARAQPEPERAGRVELLVYGTTYGLWLGVALPTIFEADEPEIFGIGLLLGGPAGFLSSKAYVSSHPVTEGQARAITFGGTWGSWQGFGWTEVLDPGGGQQCNEFGCWEESAPSAEALMAGTVIGGLAGIATGAVLARKPISSGVATTVSFGGLWGTWYGFALGVLLDLEDDELLAATLVGGDVGLLSMALAAPRWNPTRSRARLVSLGGVVGLLGGLGLDLIIQPDDEKIAVLIPSLTSAGGLLLAARSMKGRSGGGEGSGQPAAGSLLDYRAGQLQLGAPAVGLRLERDRRQRPRTALYVPLLQAAF